jgi:hypothetical protein
LSKTSQFNFLSSHGQFIGGASSASYNLLNTLSKTTQYKSMVKFFFKGFGLGSASGGSEAQAERRLERRRSATPQTSRRRKAAAVAANTIAARDERAVLRSGTGVVEKGYGATDSPWSVANRALVMAGKQV